MYYESYIKCIIEKILFYLQSFFLVRLLGLNRINTLINGRVSTHHSWVFSFADTSTCKQCMLIRQMNVPWVLTKINSQKGCDLMKVNYQ